MTATLRAGLVHLRTVAAMDLLAPAALAFRDRGLAAMCRTPGQFSLLLAEDFTILWHTESLQQVLGFEDVVGQNGVDFIHPDDVAIVIHMLTEFGQRATGLEGPAFRPDPSDLRLRTASGDWVTVESMAFDQTGDPFINGFLVTCTQIIDRRDLAVAIELLGSGRSVEEVLASITRFGDRSMGGDSRCVIAWWHDGEARSVWSSDAALPHARMSAIAERALRAGVREPITVTDFDDPLLREVGGAGRALGYPVVTFVPIVAPNGDEIVGCFVGWGHQQVEFFMHPQMPLHVGLRIAALAIMDGRTKSDLRWAAAHDPLTLLINRAEFAQRLDAMNGSDVALMYIDLDDFKPINDLHGHPVGDAVLVEVAARIRETVGTAGVACRLGGDEFAVACVADLESSWDIAARIGEAIRRPISIGDVSVAVGASIGVAIGVHPLIPSILIQRADEALLEAKHAGKNKVKFAS
jgi:diguanylate cyclase (GGDEF)-like protein